MRGGSNGQHKIAHARERDRLFAHSVCQFWSIVVNGGISPLKSCIGPLGVSGSGHWIFPVAVDLLETIKTLIARDFPPGI